jgi:GPN-loop GTPase
VNSVWKERRRHLTAAIGRVLEDYSLVKFCPLNIKDEESIIDLLFTIDNCIQYGEDLDVRVTDFDPPEPDDDYDSNEKFNELREELGL